MTDFQKHSLLHSRLQDLETSLYLIPTDYVLSMTDKEFSEFLELRECFTKLTNSVWRRLIFPEKS